MKTKLQHKEIRMAMLDREGNVIVSYKPFLDKFNNSLDGFNIYGMFALREYKVVMVTFTDFKEVTEKDIYS